MMSERHGSNPHELEEVKLRRGPWTLEEDNLLVHYIACHGEGRWNLLARCSGLKRTGKSCRLRWLNYLKPDVKRGNLTAEEQIMILELHSRWGNRWSRIAQNLPGRTDNEIKNYWRTRVQKQAKLLRISANSTFFHDMIRWLWIPRLAQSEGYSRSVVPNPTTQITISPQPMPPSLSSFIHTQVLDEVALGCSMVQQPQQSNNTYDKEAQVPVPMTGIIASDCTYNGSVSSWGFCEHMDELWQAMIATIGHDEGSFLIS